MSDAIPFPYREYCREIGNEINEGFAVSEIRINFEKVGLGTPSTVREQATQLMQRHAKEHMESEIPVREDNTISQIYTYTVVCEECRNTPFYDESKNEWYCPVCESNQKSIFDY